MFATVGVRASHDLRDARAAANSFLSAVERGDTDRAQDLMCFEASPGSVNTAMGAGVTSHRITGVSVQSGFGSQGRKTASVTADLTVGDSRHRREVLTIVHEQDSWLVCGVFYVPLG